ncbi:hypothetical protein AMTR_s00117p00042960 [Amborella trichopoda]|uniref:Pentatricopeptide repeat-containing protein n=1 Tax=Amborella trichopoda TaxID=13333 RepID=W1NTL3_AMBTC|nr:hypothetical protein AMTR_s00117p00042960 [Amborella trichopoda]
MISGYGAHGLGSNMDGLIFKVCFLEHFIAKLEEGLNPDLSTLVSICSHSALVNKGWETINSMEGQGLLKRLNCPLMICLLSLLPIFEIHKNVRLAERVSAYVLLSNEYASTGYGKG